MTVVPMTAPEPAFEPDTPLVTSPFAAAGASDSGGSFSRALEHALAATSGALEKADAAEKAFAAGRGGLQEMALERAQADIALSVAGAAASRVAQALTTILGMQV